MSRSGSRNSVLAVAALALLLLPLLALTPRRPKILPSHAVSSRLSPVAFVGVNVVPMDRDEILENQTVLVREGRITAIGPAETTRIPSRAYVVEAAGRYLCPGLSDMHVHLSNDDDLPLYVANGITTVRVMGGTKRILELRYDIRRGALLGPRIYTAGPMIDGPAPIWPQADVLTDPSRADELVREYKAAGYDFVKVYVGLSPTVYNAVRRAARKYGLRVVGHVPYATELETVLRSGQASIEHLDGYIEAVQKDDSPYQGKSDVATRLYAVDHVDDLKIREIAQATADAGVWNCPTLVVEQNWSTATEADARFQRPELQYMLAPTVEWWRKHAGTNLSGEQSEYYEKLFEVRKKLVRAMYVAGARLLAGSDSPNPLTVHGFSLHDELGYLKEAGLSNFDVLRTATVNAAEFLEGSRAKSGAIREGYRADLLLIDGNPLEDLAHLRKPGGVMLAGGWYTSAQLAQMLDDVKEQRQRYSNRRSPRRRR